MSFIKALKGGNEDKIIVSSIIGWNENPQTPYGLSEIRLAAGATELELSPVCSLAQTGTAAPALRLAQFTKSFKYNTVDTICQADLADAMKKIGEKMAYAIDPSCLSATLVDTDLDQAGVQADCQVRDLSPTATAALPSRPCLSCDSAPPRAGSCTKDAACIGASAPSSAAPTTPCLPRRQADRAVPHLHPGHRPRPLPEHVTAERPRASADADRRPDRARPRGGRRR